MIVKPISLSQNLVSIFLLFSILFVYPGHGVEAQNIFRSACQGNLQRVDSLLQTSSINAQDNRGRNLLHWAVACEKPTMFDALVAKGIDLNQKDNDGVTPWQMTIRFGQQDLFEKSVELQAQKDWKSRYGGTLLETSVIYKKPEFLQRLIALGVAIDQKNENGSTALELAHRTGAAELKNWLLAQGADPSLIRKPQLRGSYLGQTPPGKTPVVFAPEMISTEEYEFGSVFNKAGTEFYYGVDTRRHSEIRFSELIDGVWTQPRVILSNSRYGFNDPFLSNDEQRLYFISQKPLTENDPQSDYDIWYVERQDEGWSAPINAGTAINTKGAEYYISFTKSGAMYFASNGQNGDDPNEADHDIYYAPFENGQFQEAVSAGVGVNTKAYEADVFVDPNEQYLIFCSQRADGKGRGDLYISFPEEDGSWGQAVAMDVVNTRQHELCPFVSADGKYLFYTSDEDIYWVSTQIIEDLKTQQKD